MEPGWIKKDYRQAIYDFYVLRRSVGANFILAQMRIMQNTAEWDPSLDKRIHPSWKQESLDAGAWAILQNAKAETHRRSIPLRAVASRGLCRRMDALEKSFDEALELMVTQEYYMRCFEDVFDETVPPKIKALYQ